MENEEELVYSYRGMFINFGIVWFVVTLLIYIVFGLYVLFEVKSPNYFALIGMLAIFVPLWCLAYIGHAKRKKYLQSIILCKRGVKGFVRDNKYTVLPKGRQGELKWEEIEKFQMFIYPDIDSIEFEKKPGFRLVVGEQKLVIYENIKGYEELLDLVKQMVSISAS